MPEPIDNDPECDLLPSIGNVFCTSVVRAVNKDAREVAHLITTSRTDRAGDIVEARGADLSNYMRHPVVMANHSYKIEDIIGRAVSLTVEDGGIFARTKYRDTPLAKDAFNLAAEDLGAWSIGFRPMKFKAIKDEKGFTKGFNFTEWEMLEYSQVAVPMNPDIVQNALSKGLVSEANVNVFFRALDPVKPSKEASDRTNADPNPRARINQETEDAIKRVFARAEWRFAIAQAAARINAATKD